MLYLVTEKGPIFIVNVGDHLTLNKILVSAQRKNSTSKTNKQKLEKLKRRLKERDGNKIEGRWSECELIREMSLEK